MKTIPFRDIEPAAWDEAASHSSEAWLFHRHAWIGLESTYAAKANLSFAVADDKGRIVAIQPLFRRDFDRGWTERVLDCGYHRHAGFAVRDDAGDDLRHSATRQAMKQILACADDWDVDRIVLNVQNLAPIARGRIQVPSWILEDGFEAGLHMTPFGDLAVPGMSNTFAEQIVSLEGAEEILFKRLDSACQRAVRKAEKAGLVLDVAAGDPIDEYYELAQVSATRTKEKLLPKEYYRTIWNAFAGDRRAAVLFVRSEGKLSAALFLLIDKQGASFLAGVSHHDFLVLRVNDFVHWQGMRWLKSIGVTRYRLGPIFPELPTDWPVAEVSRFKSKFGGESYPVVQGCYFRKPNRYAEDALRRSREATEMRVKETTRRAREACDESSDAVRDVISVLRRYGFLGIPANARESDLHNRFGIHAAGFKMPATDAIDGVRVMIASNLESCTKLGLDAKAEQAPAHLYGHPVRRWWPGNAFTYRALLPHVSFAGPNVEPLWRNAQGRTVIGWWNRNGKRILLCGLDVAGEIVRWNQGDPEQTRRVSIQERARYNYAFERPVYLHEPHLEKGRRAEPWADRLGFFIVEQLSRMTGWPLTEVLPSGAKGMILLTGDDDQASLDNYRKQLDTIGDFPITYYLLPFTKHTPETLSRLPETVELGVHVDSLENPDRYDDVCIDQTAAVRQLTGKPIKSIRNHGFLSRGYLGQLGAWDRSALPYDVNIPGLDGACLTGSLLPFRVRRFDGSWSSHTSLLTLFGDGMRYVLKMDETQMCRRIDEIAKGVEDRFPGVLVFNMHPDNIGDCVKVHQRIVEWGRRRDWGAWGAESFFEWHSAWLNLTIVQDGDGWKLTGSRPVPGVVLRIPEGEGWRRQAAEVQMRGEGRPKEVAS
ncbi:MAG: GNAT family N-acetyltransferase [Gemmataceae bacterium]|nr:GNAT family N-acetyltransferase [Gemmataceae bacterium]